MNPFRNLLRAIPALVLCCLLGCKSAENEPALFQSMENTGIDFRNDIRNTKTFNIFSYRNFYNGGGVAIGDLNNDGLADVFFTANMSNNRLFINKGNWQFDDVSAKAGFTATDKWSTGVVMVDINNDGWLDVYVCNAGYENGRVPKNQLFINNKNLTFTDSAEAYGLTNNGGYCTHAAFFDYDIDGDLDCFIINNSFIPVNTLNYANKRALRAKDWPVADFLKGGGDKLLRNDNGKFTDISEQAGIHGSLISFGLGVTVGDVNGDRYPDIYVSNDFFERDYLYVNQKDGSFRDELEQWVEHSSLASMGADMGDVNNDGYPDIFVTDMLPADDYRLKTTSSFDNIDVYKLKEHSGFYHQFMQNTLQLNNRNGKFQDIAYYSGVAASDWSWGGLMFDADNDGWNDLYVCNGIYHDLIDQDFIDFFGESNQRMVMTGEKEQVDNIISKMPSNPIANKAFRNNGNLTFTDIGNQWGLGTPSFSNGAAYGDLDNDGDLDLVVNNVNQPSFVFKNNSRELTANNFIGVSLTGSARNTYAIGSRILVYSGKEIISRELIPTRGFQSSIDYKTIIGVGKRNVDSLVIHWPDGKASSIIKPEINKVHAFQQPKDVPVLMTAGPKASDSAGLLKQVSASFEKHTENQYIDFYQERNIPKMLSAEGPCAAVADVNGDGQEDIFIGGAAGQASQLYIQNNGAFTKKPMPAIERFSEFEDVAAAFFDADGDGDADLFIGAGGNHLPRGSEALQHRLYINDSKGNFSVGGTLPPNTYNTGVAAPHDFDADGDIDIFVGARSVSFQYGITPVSAILVNDGRGSFTELEAARMGGIENAGMITDAIWENVSGDGSKELIIVGEWMAPRIFTYSSGKFSEMKSTLSSKKGWWQTVRAADVDGDTDVDLVLGNTGENFYLRPDSVKPVKLWIRDFDGNGSQDVIISRTVDGRDVPVFLKRELTEQMPSLKKQNLRHAEYAKRSVSELLTTEQLKGVLLKEFNYASSCVAFNDGNGQFSIIPLPVEAQLSSLNAVCLTDINSDGRPDIIGAGNEFGFLPQFSRLDAGFGNVLLNKGNGRFGEMGPRASGLQVRGQIREIALIKNKTGSEYVIFLRNNETPLLYQMK